MSRTGPRVRDERAGAGNVLVRLPQSESVFEVCRRYGRPLGEYVVAVTYRPPEAWVDAFAGEVDRPVAPVVVGVGDDRRPGPLGTDGTPDVDATVEPVPDPDEIARVARRVDEWLLPGARAVVYFDSLTELLRHVEPSAAFRLLHVLSARVSHAGATAYYRFDEGTHDETVLRKLGPLFDGELFSPGTDGSVEE